MSLLFTLKSHTATLHPGKHDLKSWADLSTYRRYLLQKYKKILKPAQFCRNFFIYEPAYLFVEWQGKNAL